MLDQDRSGPDDAALLRLFVEREDRRALGLLFTRHADQAYRFALRLTGHAADAEDAVQAAFLEVFRRAKAFRGESAVKSWILGFVLNACRGKAREEGRRKARQARAAEGQEIVLLPPEADPEGCQRVREALEELPDHYRAPLWLHYAEGLSSGEVAEVLQVPENTVRKQLSRGMDQLRERLAPHVISLGLVALLQALAVETAPSSLTTSLASLAAGAAPSSAALHAGITAKLSAAGVAAMTIATTVGFLWWGGVRTEPRPPEFAQIDRVVRQWQPTPEERRFDLIGWVNSTEEALHLSQESGRPVVLLTQSGRVNLGRTDGGSQALRAGPLADLGVVELLNQYFVPAYVSNVDYDDGGAASSKERTELRRIWQDAHDTGKPVGMDRLFLLDPCDGHVLDTLELSKATRERFVAWLAPHEVTPPGHPVAKPLPQSRAPDHGTGDLVLHVTARYLDQNGDVERERRLFHEFPAEDWVVLSPGEWKGLLDPGDVDPELARRLFAAFHPVDMSVGEKPDDRNRYDQVILRVTPISRSYARLEGHLRMGRSFTQIVKTEDRPIEADIRGYLEVDREQGKIRSLRMVTSDARYGNEPFGVAVRSVP